MALDFNVKPGGSMLQADGQVRTWSSSNRIAARHTVGDKELISSLINSSTDELITALTFLRNLGDFDDLLPEYEIVVSVSQKARNAEPSGMGGQITLSSREDLEELEEDGEEG